MTGLSHLLDCQLYGLHAGGHHLINILLHAATAVLLFFVLRRMTGRFWPSALVAALFAVHPLRVESVAWVAERKDVLSGLFFMLTLGAYVGYVRRPFSWRRYLLLAVLFALGLLAKPMLVTLPLLLLLLDYWPLGRLADDPRSNRTAPHVLGRFPLAWRLVIEKLPLLLLSLLSCAATTWMQREAVRLNAFVPIWWRIDNALASYVAYVGQLFYPMGLAAYYPHPGPNLPTGTVVGAALLLACISAAAVACRRRCPYVLVGWLWYLGMLVPVIGFVQVGGQARADRYTYLPQIGLCIALVWGAADLCRSWVYLRRLAARLGGTGAGDIDGVRLASNLFLARCRDPLESHVGPHFAQQLRPQQPRLPLGRARSDRGGHGPVSPGAGNSSPTMRGPTKAWAWC